MTEPLARTRRYVRRRRGNGVRGRHFIASQCETIAARGVEQQLPGLANASKLHETLVSVGVEEFDENKLTPLLRLKYHDFITDAVADLGKPDEIGRVFSSFQKYLYREATVTTPSWGVE